jgi:hypothetical protein
MKEKLSDYIMWSRLCVPLAFKEKIVVYFLPLY